jgi:hypothetical protein
VIPSAVQGWIEKLGYAAEPNLLHVRGECVPETHPYALEIKALLKPDGAVRAQAVFDVEGVPTVVFVGEDGEALSSRALDDARKRIWNQNLATVVIEVRGDEALALPARKLKKAGERLRLTEARPDGPFSAQDVATANLSRRVPKWFDVKARVDRKLLFNLSTAVKKLAEGGLDRAREKDRRRLAELLMGQVLFVSYLEHREIVGPTYRERRSVAQLHELVASGDRQAIRTLIDRLRADFNGDFLGNDRHDPWAALSDGGFEILNQFLRRTDMGTGQGEFLELRFQLHPGRAALWSLREVPNSRTAGEGGCLLYASQPRDACGRSGPASSVVDPAGLQVGRIGWLNPPNPRKFSTYIRFLLPRSI